MKNYQFWSVVLFAFLLSGLTVGLPASISLARQKKTNSTILNAMGTELTSIYGSCAFPPPSVLEDLDTYDFLEPCDRKIPLANHLITDQSLILCLGLLEVGLRLCSADQTHFIEGREGIPSILPNNTQSFNHLLDTLKMKDYKNLCTEQGMKQEGVLGEQNFTQINGWKLKNVFHEANNGCSRLCFDIQNNANVFCQLILWGSNLLKPMTQTISGSRPSAVEEMSDKTTFNKESPTSSSKVAITESNSQKVPSHVDTPELPKITVSDPNKNNGGDKSESLRTGAEKPSDPGDTTLASQVEPKNTEDEFEQVPRESDFEEPDNAVIIGTNPTYQHAVQAVSKGQHSENISPEADGKNLKKDDITKTPSISQVSTSAGVGEDKLITGTIQEGGIHNPGDDLTNPLGSEKTSDTSNVEQLPKGKTSSLMPSDARSGDANDGFTDFRPSIPLDKNPDDGHYDSSLGLDPNQEADEDINFPEIDQEPSNKNHDISSSQVGYKSSFKYQQEEMSNGNAYIRERFEDQEDSHFFSYFLTLVVLCIVGYVVFHNKQKILALALEGRSRRTPRRRPTTANYHKLDNNLEEAVSSPCSTSVTHVIY